MVDARAGLLVFDGTPQVRETAATGAL